MTAPELGSGVPPSGVRTAYTTRRRAGAVVPAPACRTPVLPWTGHARSHHLPPGPRVHPGGPRGVPLLGSARPRHLRREGQEPAAAAQLLLRRPRGTAPADAADGHHGG